MELAVARPVYEIVCILLGCLTQQNDYLQNFRENVETLIKKRNELNSRENSVKREVSRAELEGKTLTYETEEWLKNVESLKKEVDHIEELFVEIEKGCFQGCNPRRKLSKRCLRVTLKVVRLMEESPFVSNAVAVDKLPTIGHILPTVTLVGETTAKVTLEQVWKWVTDKHIGKIGVHGMGGVGKTAIVKHINNRLKEAEHFDSIIWVSMSRAFDLESLQRDIAQAVGLDLPKDEEIESRSIKLFAALTRRKRFVLILDDLWEACPLEKIGIPQPSKDNGCKLILTTRSIEICRGMETQIDIKVDLLSEEEAWDLFEEKVGGDTLLSSNIQAVAKQVAKQCGHLPLAIITVGRALRQVGDVRVWRHTLSELQGSTDEIKDMKKNVFVPLRFSYDRLKNNTIQACFLYCALFPEDYKIPAKDLMEYWMGAGLLYEVGNREAEVDKGYFILNELKDAYMLESAVNILKEEFVWMHDLIRDLAIQIIRERRRFIVKAGVGLNRAPKEEEWIEDAEMVSLMDNKIEELSGQPNCSKLSILLLQKNPLIRIMQPFFQCMVNLTVLDLSHTLIESLPESISDLAKLRALLLDSCRNLKNVPSLEKLKELRVLNMSHTPIDRLPQGTEELVKLRRLDLSHTENMEMFPTGLLAKLSLLEDLSTYRSSWFWLPAAEEIVGGAGVEEIICSAQLSNLCLSFLDLPTFIEYVKSGHWQALKSFNFMVGWKSAVWYSKSSHSIQIVSEGLRSAGSSLVLPENTHWLHIENCHDIAQLSELFCLSKLSDLREFSIYTCDGIECLMTAEGNHLPSVELLNLWNLPSLKVLCDRNASASSFSSLKVLEIGWCNSLKSLVSLGVLQYLEKLEQIRLSNNDSLENMFEEEVGGNASTIALPNLKRLDLKYLPELNVLCPAVLICNSLNTITVEKCPKLKKIPLSAAHAPPVLEVIKGENEWLAELEWDDPAESGFFQKFFKGW